ncbi:uncharacterized protein [Antennarius striatus]|uniref:uncharacterized protein isoform X2 n=1 Tax=Antennarius striatus TaxID=241820 RepID=UPI0035B2008B
MQPVDTEKGIFSTGQLLDSLRFYLNNKKRLQPIIGLGCIVECVNAGIHKGKVLYLCTVCVCRLSKADVRNHITGSLHRFNYIKTWHPHLLSEWKENAELSKLAWPLMEKAKVLEGKEGPGHIRLLEVEDAVYQMIATCSENNVTLMNILSDQLVSQSEATPVQHVDPPIQSQMVDLLDCNQKRQSKKSLWSSAEMSTPPSLVQSPETPSASSEKSNSVLDSFKGTYSLIGLSHVVEYRSEDGHTCCFLCHCCRIRSNKKDIIDHLTSSSHLVNYLMETQPEQKELLMADINHDSQLLWSLAENAVGDMGSGQQKVVNVPESLCIQMTSKSYHWCVKMLHNGWTHSEIQRMRAPVKGPSVNKTPYQARPDKCTVGMSRRAKTMRNKKRTVFKVSLPLTKGSILLERTSFSKDNEPGSPTSPTPSDCDLIPSSFDSEDCECDHDAQSVSQSAAAIAKPLTSQLHQGMSGWFNEENNYNRHHDPQRLSQNIDKYCQNEDLHTQNDFAPPAASYSQDWSYYNASYGCVEDCAERWCNSPTQVAGRMEVPQEEWQKMTGNATQHYNQHLHYQYMTQDHAGLPAASVRQQSSVHSDAVWSNLRPDLFAHSSNSCPLLAEEFLQNEPRPWQTYMGYNTGSGQTASQSYICYI